MKRDLATSWCTGLTCAFGLIGSDRLSALRARPGGGLVLQALARLRGAGPLEIRGGIGFRRRFPADALALDHPNLYDLVRGSIEPSVQEALRRTITPGAVLFDVGANVGFFSMVGARLAGPDGYVEAFEPVAQNAAAIEAVARLNGDAEIRVHRVAVADVAGSARMWVPPDQTWAHLSDRGRHPDARCSIEVQVVRLDEDIAAGRLRVPSVIKIDVEGSEAAVLRGLERTIASHRPVIICELHGTLREIAPLVDDFGYSMENLDGAGSVKPTDHGHVLLRSR